jgi:alkyl sulfatase BDS1-like metallo-beta-lactamase superfamily hydrolase
VSDDDAYAPLMAADEYARLVREASDEDLRAGLRENGTLILEQIFLAMPHQLDRHAAAGVRLTLEWCIRRGEDGRETSRWQVRIEDGVCVVEHDGARPADVTFTIRDLDFVKLVTANARGPVLFLLGRLKVQGDLLTAARVQALFRRPDASRPAEAG